MSRICGICVATLLVSMPATSPAHGLPTIPLLPPPEPAPNSLVAAADGTLYFVDATRSTVWRLRPGGEPMPFVTGTSGPSLQVDAAGNLYGTRVERRGRVSVWRASADGTVTTLGRAGSDREARRLLATHAGACGLAGAAAVLPVDGHTRMTGGDLLITSGNAVRRVAADGGVTTLAAGGELLRHRSGLMGRVFRNSPAHLTGIAMAGDGDVYVANAASGAIVRIGRNGLVRQAYEASPGWRPAGLASVGGAIYMLEYGAGVRIRRLDDDGVGALVAIVPSTVSAAALPAGMPWLPI